jgi:hypothetical protein
VVTLKLSRLDSALGAIAAPSLRSPLPLFSMRRRLHADPETPPLSRAQYTAMLRVRALHISRKQALPIRPSSFVFNPSHLNPRPALLESECLRCLSLSKVGHLKTQAHQYAHRALRDWPPSMQASCARSQADPTCSSEHSADVSRKALRFGCKVRLTPGFDYTPVPISSPGLPYDRARDADTGPQPFSPSLPSFTIVSLPPTLPPRSLPLLTPLFPLPTRPFPAV